MTTVAFDLDGTLIDSVPHIHDAVSRALTDLQQPGLSLDETRGFVGHGLPPLLDKVMARLTLQASLRQPLYDRVMHHYVSLPNDPDSVYPGVAQALASLQASGHRLVLCTNKPGAATKAALRDTALAGFFETVIAGDSLLTRKPDPAMLIAAIGDNTPAVFVGDSEVDADTAQRAGIPFLLFTEGYRKAPVAALSHAAAFSDHASLPGLVADLLP